MSTAYEAELSAQIGAARKAWPAIDVPEEVFARALATAASNRAPKSIDARAAADLWLALACVRGDNKALAALEALAFPGARAALARMGLAADTIAEVLQILREKLLVAEPGASPKLLAMAEHGDLAGVVRVAAVRTALNLRRANERTEPNDDRLLRELSPGDDPELATLKEQHREAFKKALEDALAGLDARDRNILRMHLLHGLSIDAIGAAYQVHRATAARWLSTIRDALDRETKRLLRERRGLSPAEVDSLVRLVESRIHVSFRRVLGSAAG